MEKSHYFFILGSIGLLFSTIWSLVYFYEIYATLTETTLNTPVWGEDNTVPWYHKSPQIYLIFCFINGSLNIAAIVILLKELFNKNFKKITLGLLITLSTFLIMLFSAYMVEPQG